MFVPHEPRSLAESGLNVTEVEALILKHLLHQGTLTGRQIAQHVRLPFNITFDVLRGLKSQMLIAYKASAPMGDFEHDLSETGLQRAQRWMKRCTLTAQPRFPCTSIWIRCRSKPFAMPVLAWRMW